MPNQNQKPVSFAEAYPTADWQTNKEHHRNLMLQFLLGKYGNKTSLHTSSLLFKDCFKVSRIMATGLNKDDRGNGGGGGRVVPEGWTQQHSEELADTAYHMLKILRFKGADKNDQGTILVHYVHSGDNPLDAKARNETFSKHSFFLRPYGELSGGRILEAAQNRKNKHAPPPPEISISL